MPSTSLSDYSVFVPLPDGRTAYFPWGVYGRGYVIGPDVDRARLRWPIHGILWIGLASVTYRLPLVQGLFLLAFFVAYGVWARSRVRLLPPPLVRLTWREGIVAQARAKDPTLLTAALFLMLAFVGVGVFLLHVPDRWLLGAYTIVLFALLAATFAMLLVVRWWTSWRELQPLTWRERVNMLARAQDQNSWALLTFSTLTFAGGGVVLMLFDRRHWLPVLCWIVFFGLVGAASAALLIVRRRISSERSPRDAV